ncbi:MAG: hypothetical protein FJW35_03535 [Acidobacteria bacterium]|nr:hypothetical protein [Acidobacteriota bacterium]
MWLKISVIAVLVLAATVAAALIYGSHRWEAGTGELRARLEAARVPIRPSVVDFRELDDLPPPVQRYFRAVLKDGQPIVAAVDVRHSGTFNMGETTDEWKPFRSTQRVITRRPGFDWDARIAYMPGLPARVHDAYVAGEGILHASLFGLVSLVNLSGTGDLAQGELMRFFAEAAWYPTALLPSQGVRWEAADDRSARGTMRDGTIQLIMLFHFDGQGLIEVVSAEARGRLVGGRAIPTPWCGRLWNYADQGGMRVPLEGEVSWILPEGPRPYWRGRILELRYEFAR